MRNSIIILVSSFIMTLSALSQPNPGKDVLKKVDSEFSDYSVLHGAKDAFAKYIDANAVVLKDNNYPIVGKDNVMKSLFMGDDGGYTLSWTPLFEDLASSGEIGYTYGTYKLESTDDKGNPVLSYGTYVTIWKKDKDGNWKYVLDTGHRGLEPPKK